MIQSDRSMTVYFLATCLSVLLLLGACIAMFSIPVLGRIYDHRAKLIEERAKLLPEQSGAWREAQSEIQRLHDDSFWLDTDAPDYVLFVIACILAAGGELQVFMLCRMNVTRGEREWQRFEAIGRFPSGWTAVATILVVPGLVLFFMWYWRLARACGAIAQSYGSNGLLAAARHAALNSLVLIFDSIMLATLVLINRNTTQVQDWLVVLIWLLVAYFVYALSQLSILLFRMSRLIMRNE